MTPNGLRWGISPILTMARMRNSAALLTRDRLLVRDTERRLRKAAQGYGRLSYIKSDRVSAEMIEGLVTEKREQYRRSCRCRIHSSTSEIFNFSRLLTTHGRPIAG